MHRSLLPACRAALLALLIAPLASCGAAANKGPSPLDQPGGGSSGSPGGGAGGASLDAEAPEEPASFMRVGEVTAAGSEPSPPAASASPVTPPPSGKLALSKPPNPTTAARYPNDEQYDVETKASDSGGDRDKKPEAVKGAVVDSQGGLSEADVRAAIAGKQASFRRCYDLGVASAPDFRGSVSLRVSISPAGNVASAEVLSSSTRTPAVDACVRDEVRLLMFKASGVGAVVAFPIEFGR